MRKVIHLVDDEVIIHDIFRRIFKEPDTELIISENKAQAKANHFSDVDVVIMDLMIPGSSGLEIFKELKKDDPELSVIFLTAYGTIESAIEAIRMGAVDYLQKPFNNIELKHKIERIIREKRLKRENIRLHKALDEKFSFENIIGTSPSLLRALKMVENVAKSNSTILITGESGTGKELVAKAIHRNSDRKNRPFIPFNSSNLPSTLIESLLFGYKKGSFTGASNDKKGLFEEADNGTLFFDEIANLSDETQAKILRALQEKEIQPLGSSKIIKTDVRILAATNVDLKAKVEKKEFREDLYYRLNIINIHLPPLRERKEDIPLLAEVFLKRYAAENKKSFAGVPEAFHAQLLEYDWPGNIRELENAIQRAVLLSGGDTLSPDALPPEIRGLELRRSRPVAFNEKVESYKRELILAALDKHGWVQKKAATELKLKPSTLNELMKRMQIKK